MKTINRDNLNKTFTVSTVRGYACPNCKLETWVKSPTMKKGYCYACAYSGEPLKIVDKQ